MLRVEQSGLFDTEKVLTIIIPVYKVEAYINKCLDSLIIAPELMEKLEVLIVNDGTPDNSAEMSREYVKRYPGTFRQIDKENGGHGSAWNEGLKEAKGRYIRFLDSDDWFTNLGRLLSDLRSCDADIVFHPFVKVFAYENRTEEIRTTIKPGIVTPVSSAIWGTPEYGVSNMNFWAATYKNSILKPLAPLFAERVMYDDYILTWAPLVFGRTCIAYDYIVYNYLIGRPDQSLSSTRQRRGAISYATCFEQYETVRKRVSAVTDTIPSELLTLIDQSISDYAQLIFYYMVNLPYGEARSRMRYYWDRYLADKPFRSSFMKRYDTLPFLAFYYVERLRRSILR